MHINSVLNTYFYVIRIRTFPEYETDTFEDVKNDIIKK